MSATSLEAELALLERRLARERAARKQAETLLSSKSLELYQALETASESRRRLEMALWASGEGIWEWDAATDIVAAEIFEKALFSVPAPQMRMRDYLGLIHEEDRDRVIMAWRLHYLGSAEDYDCAYRVDGKGGVRWIRTRGRAAERDARGRARRVIGTIKDITSQRDAEESLRLMAHAFANTRDPMVVTTVDWEIVEANSAFARLTGLPQQGEGLLKLTELLDVAGLPLDVSTAGGTWHGELELTCPGGRRIPMDVSIDRFSRGTQQAPSFIVNLRDISEEKAAARRLERLATLDLLTQLPNRATLQQRIDARLAGAGDSAEFALMFVDLDGFKEVNDSLGHDVGDELLKAVATRLQEVLHADDFIGRWGGDEFVVLLRSPSAAAEADRMAQRMIDSLAAPFDLGKTRVSITPSLGIVLAPRDGADSATLLRRADSAMYAAKEAGRNRFEFYRPDLDADALTRVQLTSLLRLAADRNDFHFVVQPKVDAGRAIVGGELLIRWHTEKFGAVSPARFIPLAEQTGVIGQIGRYAISNAARLLLTLHEQGLAVPMAVNLSSKQALDPAIEHDLLLACERNGVDPRMIELEITESVLLENLAAARGLIERLRDHGFTLSLDDFGTGYSSLSYLRELPFDRVKIDRSFVRDIDADDRAAALLSGIVSLCHSLGMSTVAEGVETEAQFEALNRLGIDEYQGYWFYRPMAQKELEALLKGGE
jgi:diguanylate cyclase (GGDEF)-like protein/PAS domain S-box-containing protein